MRLRFRLLCFLVVRLRLQRSKNMRLPLPSSAISFMLFLLSIFTLFFLPFFPSKFFHIYIFLKSFGVDRRFFFSIGILIHLCFRSRMQPHYDPLSSPPLSGRSTPKVSFLYIFHIIWNVLNEATHTIKIVLSITYFELKKNYTDTSKKKITLDLFGDFFLLVKKNIFSA